MPSASIASKLEKQASGPPVAESSSSTNDNNNVNNPVKLALITIEHKIRNLEKRKTKLETYRSIQSSGKELSADQKAAVAKFDAVTQTLEFARDLSKQMAQLVKDAEKEQKKQSRKDIILKAQAETAKIREVLVIQNILSCLSDEYIRNDFITGENGAVKIEPADLSVLDKFYLDIQTRRPESADDVSFLAAAQKAAEYLSMTIDCRPKIYSGDTTFESMRRIFLQIQESGYLDKIYLAVQESEGAVQLGDTVVVDEDEKAEVEISSTNADENSEGNNATELDAENFEDEEKLSPEENQPAEIENQPNNAHDQNAIQQQQLHHQHQNHQHLQDMQAIDQAEIQQLPHLSQQYQQQPVNSQQQQPQQNPPPQPQRQRAAANFQSGTASPVQVTVFSQQMQTQIQTESAAVAIATQQQQQPLPPSQIPQQQQQQIAHQIVANPAVNIQPTQQPPQMATIQPTGGPGPTALVATGPVQTLHSVGAPHFSATTVRAVEQGFFKQHQYMQQIRPLAEVIGGGSFYFLQDSELDSPDVISQQIYETGQQQQQVAQNANKQHSSVISQQSQQPPQQTLQIQHSQEQQKSEHQQIQQQQPQHPLQQQSLPQHQQQVQPLQHQIMQQNVSTTQQQVQSQQQQHQQQQTHAKPSNVTGNNVSTPIPTQTFTNQSFPPIQVQTQVGYNQQQAQPAAHILQSIDKQQQIYSTVGQTGAPLQQQQQPAQEVTSVVSISEPQQPVIIMARIPQGRTVNQTPLNPAAPSVIPMASGGFTFESPAATTLSYEQHNQVALSTTGGSINSHSQLQQQPSPASDKTDEHYTNETKLTNEWETNNTNNSSSTIKGGRNGPTNTHDTDSLPMATATQTIEANQWSSEMNSISPPLVVDIPSKKNEWNNNVGSGSFDNRHQSNHDSNHWNSNNDSSNGVGGGGYGGRGRGQNYNRNDRHRDGGGVRNTGDRGDRGMRGGGYRGRPNNYSSQNGNRNGGNMYFRNSDNGYYQNGGGNSNNSGVYNNKDGNSRYEGSGGSYRARGGNNSTRPSTNSTGGNALPPRSNANSSNRSSMGGNMSGGTNGPRTSRGGGGGSSYVNSRQSSRQQQDVA